MVTEADLILAQRQGSDSFWESVIQDSRDRERTLNARKLCEMNTDARSFRAGDKILVASERALQDALHKHSSEMRERAEAEQTAELSYQEPLLRAEPYNDQPTETSIYDVSHNSQGMPLANPIASLEESFRNIVIDDFIAFKQNFPQHKDTITISETSRSLEEHVNILLGKWNDGTLTATYKKEIYYKMMEAKNSLERISYKSEDSNISSYFDDPTAENARKVFLKVGTTRHMYGKAIDISGRFNSHVFKRDLVEFLNNTHRYTIFIYINKNGTYTAEGGNIEFLRTPKNHHLMKMKFKKCGLLWNGIIIGFSMFNNHYLIFLG